MDDKKKLQNLDNVIPPHWMGGVDSNLKSKSGSKLSPNERVKMIEKIFEEILGRKPETRDLNYYKYSSASEESMREELLNSQEHQDLIKNGREFKKTRNLLEEANGKIKSLESEIISKDESLKSMETLLKEKNLYIEDLKKKINSQFEAN